MKFKRGKFDIILNGLCLIILVSTILFLILTWSKIPDKVPMHYDFAGNIDRWGSKLEILILPIITWIMYVFMTIIEKFPEAWNTGVKVTEENIEMLRSMMKEGVRQEIEWGHYVIGDGVPGLNKDMITDYIHYLGNLRWMSLGYSPLFPGFEKEPDSMAWVSQYSNANMVKTDFFEAKSTAYAKSTALVDDL